VDTTGQGGKAFGRRGSSKRKFRLIGLPIPGKKFQHFRGVGLQGIHFQWLEFGRRIAQNIGTPFWNQYQAWSILRGQQWELSV
jgi:hypothetical protein